ncbi:MAG: multidrug efflux RND transporter permease subunit [Betaproteobacteria bacterium]|nr:multidrug efflux RND transporter permease subunit [Betaproteobacteria bacterium]
MDSRYFIDRPVFAIVIGLVLVAAGLIALPQLPVSEYPEVAPPSVQVQATYPGASADTIARTVAGPIEEQLNGVEGLLYFNSQSASNGTLQTNVTFETGTDADQAAINVSNRIQSALPRLPEEVRRQGVTVTKRSNDLLMVLSLRSPQKSRDTLFLSNYARINVVDEVKRIPGVGDATVVGARDYSMRIWLQPDRLAQLGLTTAEVIAAVRAQNNQYAAGKVGQEPAPAGQQLVYTVTTGGRLLEAEAFAEIVVRAAGNGGILRLKDVARIELGAQTYDQSSGMDAGPATLIRVFLRPGANALDVATRVRQRLTELSTNFPADVEATVPFDTTAVVTASIEKVVLTLLEAALLVVAVVYLFLQNWRATLIPVLAVPVSLIGTLAGLYLLGLSLNQFSLFAMVLVIGIVVDDAIVVLENVERLMRTRGLNAHEASIEAMREVSGALVAIVLVLTAVFVPIAFVGGIAGALYKQFAITVAIAVVLSGVVALTLTPALCARLLDGGHGQPPRLFAPFNRGFQRLTGAYADVVTTLLRRGVLGMVLFGVLLASDVWLFRQMPTAFVPAEDRGFIVGSLTLPDAASLGRTTAYSNTVVERLRQNPEVAHINQFMGLDFIGGGSQTNVGTLFVVLDHWDERPGLKAIDLVKTYTKQISGLREGTVRFNNPPPIRGLGTAGGFEAFVQSRASNEPQALAKVMSGFTDALKADPLLTDIRTTFKPALAQLRVEVDREKALSLGVGLDDLYATLQATIGTLYVNDFNRSGRTFRVQVQSEADYRSRPEDIGRAYVRGAAGAMVPLAALITVTPTVGPELLERFDGFLSAKVLGAGIPGSSSGEVIRRVEEIAAQNLPEGYSLAWTGQAFQEKRTGNAALVAAGFAVVMVLLILAAQFERWSLPLAVVMSVPFALLGALLAIRLRDMPGDIYFNIGLVVLVGLSAKNAILILEFAAQKLSVGLSVTEAALEAARQRFRPIVMTSMAFMLGVAPLLFAEGAGAGARQSMGTGVFGGMLLATVVAPLFVPLFFRLLTRSRIDPTVGAALREVGGP